MDKIWNISSIYQLNMNLVKTILVNIKDETESWQTNQKTKLVFPLVSFDTSSIQCWQFKNGNITNSRLVSLHNWMVISKLKWCVSCQHQLNVSHQNGERICQQPDFVIIYPAHFTSHAWAWCWPGVSRGRSPQSSFCPSCGSGHILRSEDMVRTINHRVLESPAHITLVTNAKVWRRRHWGLVTLSDVMTPGQGILVTPWRLWRKVVCWSFFRGGGDEYYIYGSAYQGYCLTPAVASGLCTRDNARGWHVMIYISPNTVFFSLFTSSSSVSNV